MASEKNNLISYDLIGTHPIGQLIAFSEGVTTQRLADNIDKTYFFRVCMKKGSTIHQNYHDCMEDIVLFNGDVVEVVSNTILKNEKIIRIMPGQAHAFYAKEDSTMYCQLYKPSHHKLKKLA